MGPYKTFDVDALREAGDEEILSTIPENIDFGALVGSDADLDQQEAVLDLLLYTRDRLRTDLGVNAFLALDVDIPLEEMDAATQSIEFALASNAVVYIVPRIGDNLGVGIETGSVLEAIFREADERASAMGHQERVLFIHESGVRSAMIAAVQDRWEARVYSYEDRDDRPVWIGEVTDGDLPVVLGDKVWTVPVNDVEPSAFPCEGPLPVLDTLDMERVYLFEGELHAEATVTPTVVVELIPRAPPRVRLVGCGSPVRERGDTLGARREEHLRT